MIIEKKWQPIDRTQLLVIETANDQDTSKRHVVFTQVAKHYIHDRQLLQTELTAFVK
jgi:hypothetical protein